MADGESNSTFNSLTFVGTSVGRSGKTEADPLTSAVMPSSPVRKPDIGLDGGLQVSCLDRQNQENVPRDHRNAMILVLVGRLIGRVHTIQSW